MKKYAGLWDEIKNEIKTINGGKHDEYGEFEKDFMKIEFNSDDKLHLNIILSIYNMTIIVRSVFQEDHKYYPQVFLDECLYEL